MSGTKIKTRIEARTSLINPIKSDITYSVIIENEYSAIDLKKWFRKAFKKDPDFSGVSEYCLKKILEDQFKEDNSKGAWSKRNYDYVKYLCKEDGTDFNESTKESITMSSMIVTGLVAFEKLNAKPKTNIELNIKMLEGYLNRNFSSGFGMIKGSNSGKKSFNYSPHHNVRAILALIEINNIGYEIKEKLRKAVKRLEVDIENNFIDYNEFIELGKPEVISAFHKLFSSSYGKAFNFKKKLKYHIQETENFLIESYSKIYRTWGVKDENLHSESIDKALFLLSDLSLDSIHDNHLREVYIDAVDNLLENHLITVGDNQLAIPFVIDGEPDLAATIQFYWILLKNINYSKNFERDLNKLANFILSFDLYGSKINEFNYPWYLSSIFLINKFYKDI